MTNTDQEYEIYVNVDIRPLHSGGNLSLSERQTIKLQTLSDASKILVKLHEFFEALKAQGKP